MQDWIAKYRQHVACPVSERLREKAGRPRSGLDIMIAAVAGANDCTIVTDNERDFAGLAILNPLR